ncbi:class I SAM-dependent methyltransferase [Spirillospora sp. NBC_00431]
MEKIKVDFTPVQQTLFSSLHAKALDSRAKRPVLCDRSAGAVADRLSYDYERLVLRTDDRIATVSRARQLDRWTAEFLARHPDAVVAHLGCGVDRRVDRVDPAPGVDWYDIDLPEVIELCARLYHERPGHRWLAASVTEPRWLDELPSARPVLVVAEALTMFLPEDDVRTLFERVTGKHGTGQLIFDAYNRLALRTMPRHPTIQALGVTLNWGVDDPRELERWVPGLEFDREWYLVGSRHIFKMPPTSILISGFMFLFPRLRRISRLIRMNWGRSGVVPDRLGVRRDTPVE